MSKIKRITANIITTLKVIKETLIYGSLLTKRSSAYEKARHLKGKLKFNINMDLSRKRHRQ